MDYQRDFVIGLREVRRFYLGLALRTRTGALWAFGAVGALLGWLYGELLELPGGAPLRVAVALGTRLLVVVTALISLCLTTAGRVRRDLRREGGESYVQRVEIDGFGVRVTARGRQSRVGFDKLMRVEETGKAIYLYLSANRAWILPKDQMEDPRGECARLRALFSTVIESRRLKLKKA